MRKVEDYFFSSDMAISVLYGFINGSHANDSDARKAVNSLRAATLPLTEEEEMEIYEQVKSRLENKEVKNE